MIAGAHGVRGLIRLRSFTEDPESIADFKELTDESGERSFKVKLKSAAKDFFIAEVDGPKTKEDADALRGTKLYVARSAFPKTAKGQYYEADLIGLEVKDDTEKSYGSIRGVHDHGAGVFLEIGKTKQDSFMLPFTNAYVPDVDLEAGLVSVVIPEGWLNKEKPPKGEKA